MRNQDEASLWFESQGQDIQDFTAPNAPEFEESEFSENVEQLEDEPTMQDANSALARVKMNEPMARTIVGLMDIIVPLLLLIFLRGADKDDLKLDDEETETLVNAWSTFLGGREVSMSPGAALIVSIATVYGAKVFVAMQHSKERREKDLLYLQIQQLQAENQSLRQAAQEQAV